MSKKSLFKAVLADLDGTVNRGSILIEGAKAAYDDLSSRGIPWVFISNNASSLAEDLARKVADLGLDVREDQVVNSASALIHTLNREFRGARVMVIGQPRLMEGIEQAGAVVESDPLKTDIVVTAMDRGFTYEKLLLAHLALQHGARFWATNLDATFPVADGFRPGAGSIAAAVQAVAGRPPDRVFGKPFPDMAFLSLEILGLDAGECLVVGDRMETDILFARNAGMPSVLVLTGATARSQLGDFDFAPDYVLESIADIPDLFDGDGVEDPSLWYQTNRGGTLSHD
jgi:4-nitrophenyl phosphatase